MARDSYDSGGFWIASENTYLCHRYRRASGMTSTKNQLYFRIAITDDCRFFAFDIYNYAAALHFIFTSAGMLTRVIHLRPSIHIPKASGNHISLYHYARSGGTSR